jgi:probable rRNA maturation factor
MMSASDDTAAARQASADAYRIAISNEQQAMQVDHVWLQQIAGSVLQDEGIETAQISVALVDDPTIHDINRSFLQHDYPTDVISFLLSDEPLDTGPAASEGGAGGAVQIDGEVVISGETAARTAEEVGCPALHELALYLVHGLLHLCGYDDQTDADRTRMRGREQSHLQKFGITSNYEY